jgi:hypothetical protein
MRITGLVSLAAGAAALVFVVLGAVGAVGASGTGYACLAVCALLFGGAGLALLAGSRVMPKDWPPDPPSDHREDGEG